MKKITTRLIIILSLMSTLFYAQHKWDYEGIPYPTDWEYDPFKIELEAPPEWPSTPKLNYFFVEPNHPNATDDIEVGELQSANTNFGRFGYPSRPRKTIPNHSWRHDIHEAGTVIWIKGGVFTRNPDVKTDNIPKESRWEIQYQGTAENPVWIHGDSDDKPIFRNIQFNYWNTSHTIIENLVFDGENSHNNVMSLQLPNKNIPSHHITLRNLKFENIKYKAGNSSIVAIAASPLVGGDLHDVIAYNNQFKNCGGGFIWAEEDGDQHAYKILGHTSGGEAYRIWIIDNNVLKGDEPDSEYDNVFKGISGNFVQVGDQNAQYGRNHHVFVAGNYQEFGRHALGWTKRSSDVIFSSNYCTETHIFKGGNGQSYGHQYDLGDHNWWINNVGTKSGSGWMHTGGRFNMDGPLFVIGNQFYNNKVGERNYGWRSGTGIGLNAQFGKLYIVNNLFDNNVHGIYAYGRQHNEDDELHIYNNIFSNHSGTMDSSSKALTIERTNGLSIFIENNLFDDFNSDFLVVQTKSSPSHITMKTITELNSETWASNNIIGNPEYKDPSIEDYTPSATSLTINAGAQTFNSGAEDVYEQYINRYKNDSLYPGNPSDYWSKDFLNQPRVQGASIDIGPFEFSDFQNFNNENFHSEIENSDSVNVFFVPNPANDFVEIYFDQSQNELLEKVFIFNKRGVHIKAALSSKINISDLPQGLYFAQIFFKSGKVVTKKLIKQ